MGRFDKAAAATPAKPKKAGKEKEIVQIKGMKELASIRVLQDALDGAAESINGKVLNQMRDHFSKSGAKMGKRPDSFRGVEGFGSASCEIRKRSSRSVLSAQEQVLLEENGIDFEVIVDQEETFAIDPKYAQDEEMLAKVEAALDAAGIPEDFIQHVAKKTRTVASAQSVEQVFQLQDAAKSRELMGIVTTLAIKPKLEGATVEDAFNVVKELFEE